MLSCQRYNYKTVAEGRCSHEKFYQITDWTKALELVLVFENKAGNTTGTVYVDDIVFGYRDISILEANSAQALKPALESSFTVNGANARQCLAFTGSTNLAIKAESINENPFIESVRFEYSVDKGVNWKTIGYDYNVSKKTYKVEWQPDNARDLYSYQVRAVVADIRGNEKATGVLIECGVKPITDDEFLDLVERKSFEFFKDHQNLVTGLFSDTSGGGDASIAATGSGLRLSAQAPSAVGSTKKKRRYELLRR